MRDAFLLSPDVVFLNHGSFGACPREVFADYQRWQLELERNPVEFLGRRSADLLRAAREHLAAFVGASAADLVFVANATSGVNVVAQSLALQPGDEVLTTDHEYGACDATWQRACAAAGAHYRRVEVPLPFDADSWAARLLSAITPRTRLIFASHISSTTALIFPVAQLCAAARQRGVLTLIDGAHAPGHITLNLDAIGADFYTGNYGWPAWRLRGHELAWETRRRVAQRNGLPAIAADADHGQMVTIPVRSSDAEGLRRHLFEQHRIEIPVTQHGPHTFVRVSVQAYNTQAELDLLVDALAAAGV